MKVSRRRFIVSTAVVGGGVLIGYSATRPSRHSRANNELATGSERFITSFIKIDKEEEFYPGDTQRENPEKKLYKFVHSLL